MSRACTQILVPIVAAFALLLPLPARAAAQLYWVQTDNPAVGRVNADGSGSPSTLPRSDLTVGLAAVGATGQVNWYESTGRILRSDAQLGNVTPVVTGLPSSVLNIAVDPVHDVVFWTADTAGQVGRASLSTGSVLGAFASPGQVPDGIAVDPAHQQVYWETQSGGVYRANYDGSARQALEPEGTLGTGAIGIDLELADHLMYLAYPNANRIARASLDGGALTTVVSLSGGERPFGVGVSDGRVFWADNDGGRLRSAALDGTGVTTVLDGLAGPRAVAVLGVPEPGAVTLLAFGCALPLLRRARRRPTLARKVGRGGHTTFTTGGFVRPSTITVSLITFAVLLGITRGADAAIVVTPVDGTQATTSGPLGAHVFNIAGANGGTAYYFGNIDANANPLLTSNRVDLDGSLHHYFQAATALPATLTATTNSGLAYRYLGAPNGGATTGVNFSTYDVNKDGKPDTVFELNFGPDLNDRSDDRIVAYAYDASASGIDVAAARAALVPEPGGAALLVIGAAGALARARRRSSRRAY